METQELPAKTTSVKELLQSSSIQRRFENLLGKKSQGFISSLLQVVNSNNLLQKATPQSVLNAAVTAATLDLPVNHNLGFSWIVPYKKEAQFQMGWKGYVQLALRTGQYERINVIEVYANQYKSFNSMTEELDADFNLEGEGDIVGYCAYFKLINGFEKTVYWTKEAVEKHAGKYSQSYNKSFSPWKDADQFHLMAKKTVLKNTISKWGIMSIEMQTAQLADQSVQNEEGAYRYPDNTIDMEYQEEQEEINRALKHVATASTLEDLELLEESYPDRPEEVMTAINNKRKELTKK